jgi:hypothetical protein
MKAPFTFLLWLACLGSAWAQEQQPAYIALIKNSTVSIKGDLSDGQVMADLSWAWNSSVACFPQTAEQHYRGRHVIFTTDIPKYSELIITLIPNDGSAPFALYAYQVGEVGEDNLVPNLSSCIRCEADPSTSGIVGKKRTDNKRQVRDLLAINNPYQAVIVVVGPEDWDSGAFELLVEMKGR